MKARSLFILLIFIVIFGIKLNYAIEPKNLALVEQELMHYHDSHQYEKDIKSVINKAMNHLKAVIAQTDTTKTKLAIVLDIDETALSNYGDMIALNFGGSLEQIIQEEDKGTDPAIYPTLELFQYAKAHNVAVFFVTGRTEKSRVPTERNLQNAGYKNWDGLILKPDDYKNPSAAPYKIAARKKITEQGYKIILNIGDQDSDLKGGYSEKSYKLPNPYYLIP